MWGVLSEISEGDLKRLDEFEGKAYHRFQLSVTRDQKKINDVWVYQVTTNVGFVQPATFYMDWIIEAAEEFSFPNDYCEMLRKVRRDGIDSNEHAHPK